MAADRIVRWCLSLVSIVALAVSSTVASAQCRDSMTLIRDVPVAPLPMIGGVTDDRSRMLQDLGRCPASGELVRSTAALTTPLRGAAPVRWAVVAPVLESAWNSALPFSMNDGAAWAGRGLTTVLTAGVRAETRGFALTFAPQIVYEQNRDFLVPPGIVPGRSPFSNPWHTAGESIDLPLRFGNQPTRIVTLGESRLEYQAGAVGVGVSTESLWWGPGIRNALVMSNNAAGIPQLYVRTGHPVTTPLGRFEGRFFVGSLTESIYFDGDPANDNRSLNAFVATLNVAADTGLTVGFARAVYAPVRSPAAAVQHVFDGLVRWNQPDTSDRGEQIYSLFGRWVFPESGIEIYGEWAQRNPPAVRDLLVQPQTGQAFTVGLQWVRPVSPAALFRAQFEATMLEQTPATPRTELTSFYTGVVVPQGYTQRGQPIGAAIGPGSSSQWIAGDYVTGRWRIGLFAGRIRLEDDAYYLQVNGVAPFAHDVSLFAGIRAAATLLGSDIALDLQRTNRMNYLFQSATHGYSSDKTFDVHGSSLRLSVTPASVPFRHR